MTRGERKWDVVVLGGINTDYVTRTRVLPQPGQTVAGESFFSGPGGKGANQAVAAARLGARVALIGRVGDEARGREMLRALRREKIDVRHVSFDPSTPTGAALIGVEPGGEKQILVALGANHTMSPKQIDEAEALIARAKVLMTGFEAPVQAVLRAARIAKKHGVKIVLDPSPPVKIPRELLRLVDVIRPNADEAEQITGLKSRSREEARKAGHRLLELGVGAAALSAGSKGDLVVTPAEELFLPRLKVKSVDETGAGDAFAGGLATALAFGMPLKDAALFANAVAALSTTKFGAQAGLPSRREVESFLRRKPRSKS